MTIDERLEKLVERHGGLKSSIGTLKYSIDGVKSSTSEIAEATARLLHIAQIHGQRITRLEGESRYGSRVEQAFRLPRRFERARLQP